MTTKNTVVPESRPKLRWPLDIQHIVQDGQQLAIIRDPLEIAPETVVLPSAILPLMGAFDGNRSVQQILQAHLRYGVTETMLNRFISDLESYFLLESDQTLQRWNQIVDEYRSAPFRQAVHAGAVYSAEPNELAKELKRYISEAETKTTISDAQNLLALILPHIDYRRGWPTYGAGYSILEHMPKPDVIFLLGTAHQGGKGIYHLTNKDFETPFGNIPVAREVVEDLGRLYGTERSFREEILHRREHSLELQLPFLAYRFRENEIPAIVPILVGSFHKYLISGQAPEESGEVRDFVGALSEMTKRLQLSGKRVVFWGGVDLAHVGTHFGDDTPVSPNGLPEIEKRDNELLSFILAGNMREFFQHMAEDMDRRRICGFPSIYTMLSAMKNSGLQPKGKLIEYRQAVDPDSDCIVTFASAYWTK